MAEIRVNPTRMELKKLKIKLATARRGHKLLKDKCDELMKQFLDIVREAKELRESLGKSFAGVIQEFEYAAAESDIRMLTEALMLPEIERSVNIETKNIMSVIVPEFSILETSESLDINASAGYGYAFTSKAIDSAVHAVYLAANDLVKLASLEKKSQLLCIEIEKTRRRVNALEYIMIPQYEDAIKRITMKLDENERSNLTRLMKVKDMMIKEKISLTENEY